MCESAAPKPYPAIAAVAVVVLLVVAVVRLATLCALIWKICFRFWNVPHNRGKNQGGVRGLLARSVRVWRTLRLAFE